MQALQAAMAQANANAKPKSRAAKLAKDAGISDEHENDLEATIKYMEDHRIQELFNELLCRVLEERPGDAKYRIVQLLKTVQKVKSNDKHCQRVYQILDQPDAKGAAGIPSDEFLAPEDFESLFDSYDIFGIQSVPINYLCQAMKVAGITDPEKILTERYKEILKDEYVNKASFVFILQEEHHRLGFSYKKIE